jgi:hypothetical protein
MRHHDVTTPEGPPLRLYPGQRVPDIKRDDPDELKPQLRADAHVRMFYMGKPDDVREYQDIYTRVTRGQAVISADERHWGDKTQSFLVFLRWGELFLELPKTPYQGRPRP